MQHRAAIARNTHMRHRKIGRRMGEQQSSVQRELCDQSIEAIAFEFALNKHEIMRAEVTQRRRGKIVVISRWKATTAGRKRTGQALEFAAHHLDDIVDLLCDLLRALKSQEPHFDQPENAATPFIGGAVDLIAEQQRGRIPSVAWFTANQVNGLALAKSPWGYDDFFLCDDVVFLDRSSFEFARYMEGDDEKHESAYTIIARDILGDPIDIVAWDPASGRLATWRNRASILGEDQLNAPRLADGLPVFETPLQWLQQRRLGVVVIDAERAAPKLREAAPLLVTGYECGMALRAILKVKAPQILLPSTAPEEAYMTVVDLEQEQKNRKRAAKAAVDTEVTEDAAALAFRDRLSGDLRFDHERQQWLRWDGQRWRVDKTSFVMECIREIIREKAGDQTPGARVRLGRYSFACGVEKFARSDRAFAVDGAVWDSNPLLLGTPGGTVDLRTGVLRSPTPEDHITKISAIVPAEQSKCPMWLKFLGEAAGDDADLIRFIRQFCGYSLTGSTKEHIMVFVYGPGGNGKSVFVNTLTGIFGEYCTTAPMDTLISSRSDRHPTEVARLMGARLVTASETEKNHAFAEAKLKALTGGDRVAARFMRQNFFEFIPTGKWIVVGNHKPSLTCVDEAIKRRLLIVPFIRQPAHPDCDLEEKLKAEWPAILRWMIEGSLDYLANGLLRPETAVAATNEYFENQDLFGQWLDEKCDIDAGNWHVWDPVADLYVSWSAFATASGEPPESKKTFSEAMQSRGLELGKGAKGKRVVRGVRLKRAGERHAD